MIKRKSMLGRRNRAQQSPSTFQSQSQTFSLERPMDVPRQTDKPIPDPFSTPASMNGSLSNIGAASWEPWSVFKNVRGLSSAGKRNNTILPSPKPSVSTIRRHYQQKTADRQATTKTPNETRQLSSSAAPSCVALYPRALKTPILSHPLPRMASGSEDDAELLQPSRSGREVPTISIEAPSDEIKSDSGSSQELSNLKKQWDTQDIRNVSPPWSNGLNTLTDFNFHTPAQPTSQGRKLENADSPFDVFPQDHTIIPKNSNHDEPEKIERTYTVLEKTTQQDVDGTIDLRTALCDVSLGVYSLDVLDKHNMVKMSQPNWGSKFKQPLPRLSEGPEASKENIQPTNAELSPLRDELEETISDSSEDPDNGIDEKGNPPSVMMQIRDRLAVLNSKIEGVNKGILQAEQKRRQAEEERSQKEEERRVLESEKKKILEDLMESMDRPQMFGLPSKKRRIVPSTVKKGPSFVASKILKRDCKSPRVFVDSNMRTPNHKGRSSMKFNLYTPKSLGKTLNQQFDCLFKSEG